MSISSHQLTFREGKQQTSPLTFHRRLRYLTLLIGLILIGQSALAASTMDRLVVIHGDGERYTTQITLHSDNLLINLELPRDRINLGTHFFGPEHLTFKNAHRLNPDNVAIWSGTAVTRYQGRWETQQKRHQLNHITIQVPLAISNLYQETKDPLIQTVTWLIPDDAELLSIAGHRSIKALNANSSTQGNWHRQGRHLSYLGTNPVSGILELKFNKHSTNLAIPCKEYLPESTRCASDNDNDGIPDYRDVCLNTIEFVDTSITSSDPLGCAHANPIILQDVNFQTGKSYLDAASRSVLDRVARAMHQQSPDTLFMVEAHTDNQGGAARNLRLSELRADATRHYLLLRGVKPHQIQSKGFGESFPIQSNLSAKGRTANRRIAITRMD